VNRTFQVAGRLAFVLLLATASPLLASDKYRLTLVANPAAPFPFLAKFGKVTLDVYPHGVRADSVWLNGFSRVGSPSVTVENPFTRMYTEVPVTSISSTLRKLSTAGMENAAAPALKKPAGGAVKGIAAIRYRLEYGPQAWIDVWMTRAVPENAQLRAIAHELVAGIAPSTASVLRAIPGTPVYVELNFRRYKKVKLLELKSLVRDDKGEAEALKVAPLYFRVPLLDAIWN
jgi:hypothetical protein